MPFTISENDLLSYADNLAEAATNFQGHGYALFLTARDTFITELHKFVEEHERKDVAPS